MSLAEQLDEPGELALGYAQRLVAHIVDQTTVMTFRAEHSSIKRSGVMACLH